MNDDDEALDRYYAEAAVNVPTVTVTKIRPNRESELLAEIERLRKAAAIENEEICQSLGQALGYPWFKDDPKNFPDATERDGVCVGDHVAASLAEEAARKIRELQARVDDLERINGGEFRISPSS